MSLRTVIFDMGGVLLRTFDSEPRARWERECGLAPGELGDLVFNSEHGVQAQLGLLGEDDLWHRVQQRLGLSPEQRERLRSDFFAGDQVDRELVSAIDHLRTFVTVGLLSNASAGLRSMLAHPLELASHFDHITISAEEGLMKPDPRIFHISLSRAGALPSEAVFVDDSAANVRAARQLGMVTIHYRTTEATLQELSALTGMAQE
jgi:putative hydrolase of the HAD superfamily